MPYDCHTEGPDWEELGNSYATVSSSYSLHSGERVNQSNEEDTKGLNTWEMVLPENILIYIYMCVHNLCIDMYNVWKYMYNIYKR